MSKLREKLGLTLSSKNAIRDLFKNYKFAGESIIDDSTLFSDYAEKIGNIIPSEIRKGTYNYVSELGTFSLCTFSLCSSVLTDSGDVLEIDTTHAVGYTEESNTAQIIDLSTYGGEITLDSNSGKYNNGGDEYIDFTLDSNHILSYSGNLHYVTNNSVYILNYGTPNRIYSTSLSVNKLYSYSGGSLVYSDVNNVTYTGIYNQGGVNLINFSLETSDLNTYKALGTDGELYTFTMEDLIHYSNDRLEKYDLDEGTYYYEISKDSTGIHLDTESGAVIRGHNGVFGLDDDGDGNFPVVTFSLGTSSVLCYDGSVTTMQEYNGKYRHPGLENLTDFTLSSKSVLTYDGGVQTIEEDTFYQYVSGSFVDALVFNPMSGKYRDNNNNYTDFTLGTYNVLNIYGNVQECSNGETYSFADGTFTKTTISLDDYHGEYNNGVDIIDFELGGTSSVLKKDGVISTINPSYAYTWSDGTFNIFSLNENSGIFNKSAATSTLSSFVNFTLGSNDLLDCNGLKHSLSKNNTYTWSGSTFTSESSSTLDECNGQYMYHGSLIDFSLDTTESPSSIKILCNSGDVHTMSSCQVLLYVGGNHSIVTLSQNNTYYFNGTTLTQMSDQ